MTTVRPRRVRAVVLGGLLAGSAALAGCTSSGHPAAPPSSPSASSAAPSSPSSASTPAPASPRPAAPTVNPFTGGKPSGNGVVAVKIDDTAGGRPQRNIDAADIVYIEEVEGGLTRLLAIYDTSLPTVESVRSTRAADPEIAAQYGPIAYVASGGQHNPVSLLDRSPLKVSLDSRNGPGLARDPNRPIPYNLTANLATVAKALKAPTAKSIGLTWSASTAQLTSPGLHVRTIVGGTPVAFDWSTSLRRYVRLIGGAVQHQADGRVVSTPNVVVQFCKVTPYLHDIDVNGNPNMYTHTVGSGKVVVFRDGKRVVGTWSRPTATAGTTYRTAAGKPIALHPGGAWVVLVHTTAALS